MSELPFDLLVEILIRVPVKDIVRFTCVCKKWRLLFQDERFISKHATFTPNMFLVSGSNHRSSYVYKEVDTSGKKNMILQDGDLNLNDHSDKRYSVAGHCNGLFCLLFEDAVVVWNPSLRELRRRPIISYLNLHFSCHVGFWYDHSIKDYKILLIPYIPSYVSVTPCLVKFHRQAEILTLKSSPRIIDFPSDKHLYDYGYRNGILVGGYIFWQLDCGVRDINEAILSFDTVAETINYCSSPCPVGGQLLLLTSFRERLCLVQHLHAPHLPGYNNTEVNVWCADHEEKDMSRIKSWSKLFRLDLTDIKRSIHCGEIYEVFLDMVTKAGEFFMRLQFECPCSFKAFAYNFEKNEFRELNLHLDANGNERMFEYEATLVPIHNTSSMKILE